MSWGKAPRIYLEYIAMEPLNLAILCSHNGSNLQAIIDACNDGQLNSEPRIVIGNNSRSCALGRARLAGISACHLSGKTHPSKHALDVAILETLQWNNIDLVLLAGYMKKLGPKTIRAYQGRILNIHPALLPRHGGKTMYGRAVHQAVLDAGERVTGVSVHLVDNEYDHGEIISQSEVPVRSNDTVDSLAERVLKRGHELYVRTIQQIERGNIKLPGLRV